MTPDERRFSIPARVAAGVCVWAAVLLLAWAIRPVDDVATYAPVDDPSPTEQKSIDSVLRSADEPPRLVEAATCASSPLRVATGGPRRVEAPILEAGFEYTSPPCSDAYDAATAAFWVNLLVIVTALVVCAVLHLRLRRGSDGESSADRDPAADVLLGG